MNVNATLPAFPVTAPGSAYGINIRTHIATELLKHLMTGLNMADNGDGSWLAEKAVEQADALINALNK